MIDDTEEEDQSILKWPILPNERPSVDRRQSEIRGENVAALLDAFKRMPCPSIKTKGGVDEFEKNRRALLGRMSAEVAEGELVGLDTFTCDRGLWYSKVSHTFEIDDIHMS